MDENNDRIFEIEGFDNPISTAIGSAIKHDVSEATLIQSAEDFMAFANKYNKRLKAKEFLNELNELTKETGCCGIKLS